MTSLTSTIVEAALSLSRWIELSMLAKATIMLLIGLAVAGLAGHARASVRHLLLATTFAMLLALPLFMAIAPAVTLEVPVSQPGDSGAFSNAVTPSVVPTPAASNSSLPRATESDHRSALSWTTILRVGWIAGAILLLASLAIELRRFRLIRRDGLPWLERRELMQSLTTECVAGGRVEILLHEKVLSPVTYGMWRPTIVLPYEARDWSEADLRRALVHEMEHVRRRDWIIHLMARATCALYWFHPLVWIAGRRLSLEAERACDDAVIRDAEGTAYAEQLVLLARRLSNASHQPALGMANRSDLSTRVSALLNTSQRRGRAGLITAASAISIASLVTLSIATVRAVEQSGIQATAATQESSSTTEVTQVVETIKKLQAAARRPSALDRALIEAAESGEVSDIDGLLKDGANVNCVLKGDGTPLIIAAREGHLTVVRMLLDRGADPNLGVPGDGNPLIMAAREGHLTAVQLLLDRGADPNLAVPGDGNALIMAAREGHQQLVELLLDRGASIDQMVPGDENALIQASGNGHLQIVKLLISRGADVNARVWAGHNPPNGEWRSPLSMARKGGHREVVAFLLEAGARE